MTAQTSRHTIQAQAQSWVTHDSTNKQTASRHTRHKKTTTDTIIHRDIQDTRRQDRHKKTTTDTRIHRDNNRQHKHCNTITCTDALPCFALPCGHCWAYACIQCTHSHVYFVGMHAFTHMYTCMHNTMCKCMHTPTCIHMCLHNSAIFQLCVCTTLQFSSNGSRHASAYRTSRGSSSSPTSLWRLQMQIGARADQEAQGDQGKEVWTKEAEQRAKRQTKKEQDPDLEALGV